MAPSFGLRAAREACRAHRQDGEMTAERAQPEAQPRADATSRRSLPSISTDWPSRIT